MEILPPTPPFLLILPQHLSLSAPPPSYRPLFSSLMSFFLFCVYPPWCLESSSFSVSIPVHSNLFSLQAECLFQPLTTFSPLPSISALSSTVPLCLLNHASNHFLSSLVLLLVSSFSSLFLSFSLKSLATPPLPAVFTSSPSLSVHQMVHFSLTQCILIPMAVACRVRATRTTATVY